MTLVELRAARLRLGMSAAQLATALRLGKDGGRTVRRWESGERPISGPVSVAIEHLLSRKVPPMSKHVVVKFDETNRRAVQILDDPVAAHLATFEWLFQKLPFPVMVIEGPIDLAEQTIKGVPIQDIFARGSVAARPRSPTTAEA